MYLKYIRVLKEQISHVFSQLKWCQTACTIIQLQKCLTFYKEYKNK